MANSAEKFGVSQDRNNDIKLEVVKSFMRMLENDILNPEYDADQKESLTVAKQCLEAAYDIDADKIEGAEDLVEMFHLQNIPTSTQKSESATADAEQYKALGNESMKHSQFVEAIQHYTKACRLNPTKAIYFCNRAAAYSRLEKHHESIKDCEQAIKLDPTYGKAFGRLGIAYSNLQMFRDATVAYKKALELDPTNLTYQANLKLAEGKITTSQTLPTPPPSGLNFSGIMSNPALFNMAAQMLSEPSFREIVNGIMTTVPTGGEPSMDTFVQVGQQLADHMQVINPTGLETLRRQAYVDAEVERRSAENQSNLPSQPDGPPQE